MKTWKRSIAAPLVIIPAYVHTHEDVFSIPLTSEQPANKPAMLL